jgi:hypothetical protein
MVWYLEKNFRRYDDKNKQKELTTEISEIFRLKSKWKRSLSLKEKEDA